MRELLGCSRAWYQRICRDVGDVPATGYDPSMQYMVIERFKDPRAIYRRLQERGRLMPDGLVYLNSWISGDLERCFQLMEADDRGPRQTRGGLPWAMSAIAEISIRHGVSLSTPKSGLSGPS